MDDNYFYENFADKSKSRRFIWVAAVFFVIFSVFYFIFFSTPGNFPTSRVVSIKSGNGLLEISNLLDRNSIIRSPFWFRNFVIIFGGEKGVMAGDYIFEKKQNVISVAYRLVRGERGIEPLKIVIPEGLSSLEISDILAEHFKSFDKKKFLKITSGKEGYLFPDTYLFMPDIKPEEIVEKFTDNFEKKTLSLNEQIEKFGKSMSDIVIMASILEEEARTLETRRMIAGILWKRLSIDMPLQVDATFQKINGKNTFELSLDDLKIDSLFNTYLYKGLPPEPINNPGIDTILAAITPTESNYFYYLTGKDGKMHYATTHDGHVANKDRYLR